MIWTDFRPGVALKKLVMIRCVKRKLTETGRFARFLNRQPPCLNQPAAPMRDACYCFRRSRRKCCAKCRPAKPVSNGFGLRVPVQPANTIARIELPRPEHAEGYSRSNWINPLSPLKIGCLSCRWICKAFVTLAVNEVL